MNIKIAAVSNDIKVAYFSTIDLREICLTKTVPICWAYILFNHRNNTK